MPIDLNDAIELAKNEVCEEYRRSIEIQPCESPDVHPYGFDPDRWTLFVVIEKFRYGVGASNYVGVNMETGETKYFGKYGE